MKKQMVLILLCLICLVGVIGCEKKNNSTIKNENEVNESEVKAETKKLGDTISLDFVEVSLDILEVKDNYEFEYTKPTSYGTSIRSDSIEPKTSDFKLVTLRGNFTNKSSKEIYTSNRVMYGIFKINGNEYKATIEGFNTAEAERFSNIQPQQKVEYFFYAEVPKNVADNITECEIKFGFKKDFDVFVSDFSDLDYIYELNAMPAK